MKRLVLFLVPVVAFFLSYRSEGQTPTVKDELAKAQSLAEQGNAIEASKVYTEIMGKYPDNREAVQGWLMINMKRSPTGEEDAIKQLEELEKSYPDNTAILFFKIFIQNEYKHYDDALANVERLITIQPDTALNWLMKGQILESVNKYEEALNAYNKATTLDPKNADSWQNLAGLLAKTNKFEEAILSYNRAIQLAPGQPVFIYNRGCAYCRNGDPANALADLGKAISMNPEFKSYATKDEDFKSLWDNEDFKKLTESTSETTNKGDVASAESACSIAGKNYVRQEFIPKISGTWKAVEAWIHEANLLGERNFYFTFLSNDSIKISEPERNWHSNGTWSIDLNENIIQWNMSDANNSFKGKYDLVDGQLLLSGKGFVGADEYVCLRLKRQ